MARVISLINMKGGVGKTTLTVNIACALAYKHKKKVLIVDVDPQFNASTYLMSVDEYVEHTQNEKKSTILDIFKSKRSPYSTVNGIGKQLKRGSPSLQSCIYTYTVDLRSAVCLDIIPSHLTLMEIITSERLTENRLKHFLDEKAQHYDYVLIDCPPTISIFTQASILASDSYLVPLKPDPLSTIGLPLLERWLDDFTTNAGMDINPLGIVFCLVRRNPMPNAMKRVISDLRNERPSEVFENCLSESTKVAESVEQHKPIFLHDPNGRTAAEVFAITEEFLRRTEGD